MPQPPKKLPTSKSCQNPQSKHKQKIVLEWRDGGKAPLTMERGGAVGNGNMAYFLSVYGELFSYNVITKKWSELPKCPYGRCSFS